MPIHAVLFQRSLLASDAKSDERFDVYEDCDFWAQLALNTPFTHIAGISAAYRLAGSSGLSNDSDSHFVKQARSVFYEKWRAEIPPNELATAFARAEETRLLINKLKADFQGLQEAYSILERDRRLY